MIFDETGKTANHILDSAIHDRGGEGAQERHERRLRAMRSLGAAERRFDTTLKTALLSILLIPVVFIALAIAVSLSR